MTEFWAASGYRLARRTPEGWLGVTDALLRAWLARPEVLPPPDACDAEFALHARLTRAPRAPVPDEVVASLSDPDARENWRFLLAFRERLLAAGTVEGAYLEIVRRGAQLPPLFLDQLAQLSLRNALDACEDPFVLRAAELFFRPQRATVRDGALILADAERVERLEEERHRSPLTAMFASDDIDVLTAANGGTYWKRSDGHSMALNFGGDPAARAGLAMAIEVFVRHMLRVDVAVAPLRDVEEPDLRWFVGLDAEATTIGNAIWRGEEPEAPERLVGLFRLDVLNAAAVEARVTGRPIYLLMALSARATLRLKPQNLIVGLPLLADLARP